MARARVRNPLADPIRVATLRATGLLGGQKEEAFERLAGLAARFTGAPMAMVALLDDPHLHTLARVGPPHLAEAGRAPVKDTFCRHVVSGGEALIVDDAREHSLTKGLASVKSGKVLAYAGIPLPLGGLVLGTLCVADDTPRAWKPDEISVLEDLARSVVTEIELRADVGARKQAETDLQRSDDRLRGLMENSPAAIYARDLDGRWLFLNRAAERVLGVKEADVVGTAGDGLSAHDQSVISGGRPVESEETLEVDGETVVHRSVKFPLTDQAGEPYAICGIATDVTERKQTEAALFEAQQRFGSAFEHAPTGMAMVGTDGRFRQVNAALCELTGRSQGELLRLTLADTVHPEEWATRKGLFERMLTGEIRTHQTRGRLLAGGGGPRWVLVDAAALTDADGLPAEFFVQFQDITEPTRGHHQMHGEIGAHGEPAELAVLVVDDNAVNRTVAAEMLRKRGHRVEVAKNGEEAVAAAAAERFAVILMDCDMPIMDGYEATRAIRASENDGPRAAIVAMTSDAVDSVREACFDAGMDDYLAKPVTGATLGEAIERRRPADDRDDLDLGVLDRLTTETSGHRDTQLIKSLAGVFREDANRGLREVADALRDKDAQGVARAAHALKGSSGQLGATRTEAISAELQAVAETGELGSAKALLRRLETAVDAAQSALAGALPEEDAK